MNRKIIFLDCDGTLFDVPRGMPVASDKTIYAIKELIHNGHIVFIASGRCDCLVPDFIKKLKPNGFITSNGAHAYNEKEVIYSHDISKENINAVKNYCLEHNGCYCLETQDYIYTGNKKNSLFIDFGNCWDIDFNIFEDEPSKDIGKYQMMMSIFNNEKECDEFEKAMNGIVDVRKQYGYTSFDIMDYGFDKGYGVKKILEYYQIDKNDAMAFGDGLNDIEMLEAVGESYCMKNGNEKVKTIAKHIAPDVLHEGFYETVVELGLIEPMN